MAASEIEAILRKTMGLKVSTIGQKTLDRAISRRIRALSLPDEQAYLQHLRSSLLELNELIEEVVIPETWFFRDQQPFDLLTQKINEWKKDNSKGFLRLLSAPCSSGEEPYSLVIALLESGWPINKFQVMALDISARSLARAQKGEYTENSFRSSDLRFRDRYFKMVDKKYILNREAHSKVHFRQGNLLNPAFMAGLGLFDIIFCKNVLIYLDGTSRKQAINSLKNLLVDDGIIFVGHAETAIFVENGFISLPFPHAFAFKKPEQKQPSEQIASIDSRSHQENRLKLKKELKDAPFNKARETVRETGQSPPVSNQSASPSSDLDAARRLADQGLLEEARAICMENLETHGPSPSAYFLLGLIQDTSDEPEKAEQSLRKAIYLKPDYIDALILLKLLAEKAGNTSGAQSFSRRIERLEEIGIKPEA